MSEFTPRLTSEGLPYGASAHQYYWDHANNPYATYAWCLANCTCYAYGRALEIGSPAPITLDTQWGVASAYHWNVCVGNGWRAIPWDASQVSPGDILQYGDYAAGLTSVNHVAFVEKVEGGVITTSNSNYTGDDGTGHSSRSVAVMGPDMASVSAWMLANVPSRFFTTGTSGYAGTPTYILKNPGYTPPTPPSDENLKWAFLALASTARKRVTVYG